MHERGVGLDVVAPQPAVLAENAGPSRARSAWVRDAVGLAWTVAAAALVPLPALRPGVSLGPFDLASRFGLTRHADVVVHNDVQADHIQALVPWTNLAWHQVHGGQLPVRTSGRLVFARLRSGRATTAP